MSSDEDDQFVDMDAIRKSMALKNKSDRFEVSGWDDANDGIDSKQDADEADQKAVLLASENGELNEVQKLISAKPSLLSAVDKDGYTPLHRACYGNSVSVVEYLLQAGADINAETEDGWQPLHSACCWNNVECASLLIANGADVNARSKGNQTPLHLASANSSSSETLQLLLLHPDIQFEVKNASNDTAYDIAKRTGKYYVMFEIAEPCLNKI